MNCPNCNRNCFPVENPDGTPAGLWFECEACSIDFCVDEKRSGQLAMFIRDWSSNEVQECKGMK